MSPPPSRAGTTGGRSARSAARASSLLPPSVRPRWRPPRPAHRPVAARSRPRRHCRSWSTISRASRADTAADREVSASTARRRRHREEHDRRMAGNLAQCLGLAGRYRVGDHQDRAALTVVAQHLGRQRHRIGEPVALARHDRGRQRIGHADHDGGVRSRRQHEMSRGRVRRSALPACRRAPSAGRRASGARGRAGSVPGPASSSTASP